MKTDSVIKFNVNSAELTKFKDVSIGSFFIEENGDISIKISNVDHFLSGNNSITYSPDGNDVLSVCCHVDFNREVKVIDVSFVVNL